MSWNFQVDDLRKNISELNTKLAVQGVRLGEQETKVLRAEGELESLRDSYDEAMHKLREEADRALQLESTLRKAQDDFTNEKLARENVEKVLRTSKEERKKESSSLRETQYLMDRLASDSSDSASKAERYVREKSKLEAQVRELQGELSRQQAMSVPPAKTPSRRRSSSLSNLNKLVALERDMESMKESTSASQTEAVSAREKLAKATKDLLRVENEKIALEKRLRDMDASIRHVMEEKEELQREVDFHRNRDASSQESDLMDRLEHEESKVALLESQLAQMSRSREMKSSVDRLSAQLRNEIAKREVAESREIELTEEREEALDELHDLQDAFEALQAEIQRKEEQIKELETRTGVIQQQAAQKSGSPPSSPLRIDEQKVDELLGAIGRLREERDDLKSHLEFAQMEAHFEIEGLRKQLSESRSETAQEHQDGPLEQARQIKSLHTALTAVIVTIQHIDGRNADITQLLEKTSSLEASLRASASSEVTSLQARLAEQEEERFRLSMEIGAIEEQSRLGTENLQHELTSLRQALTSKEDEIVDAGLKLRDADANVSEERSRCEALEVQVQDLEVDCNTIKQELADALDNVDRLEARQAANMTADAITKSLRTEVEELKARVLRRTEQIGLQQHDIKRLETNLRLTEDTLEETRNDLDIARTENEAMLDDCSTSRAEREEAQKALIESEMEVERLTSLLDEHAEEITSLKDALATLESESDAAEARRTEEISALQDTIEEYNDHEAVLTEKLTESRSALIDVQGQVALLTTELATARDQSQKLASESKHRSSAELQTLEITLQQVREELTTLKTVNADLQRSMDAAMSHRDEAASEVEHLRNTVQEATQVKSNHDSFRDQDYERVNAELVTSQSALVDAEERLATLESTLDQRSEELRLALKEVDIAKGAKEERISLLKAEIASVTSKLEASEVEQIALVKASSAKDELLSRLQEEVLSIEAEKADFVARLVAFENGASHESAELAALQSSMEEEQSRHHQSVNELESKIKNLEEQVSQRSARSESSINELSAEKDALDRRLEESRNDLEEQRAANESLVSEHSSSMEVRKAEIKDLRAQIADLQSNVDVLSSSLEEEKASYAKDLEAREAELKAVRDAQGTSTAEADELVEKLKVHNGQLEEVRSQLALLQDENVAMQSELDDLGGERRRADLQLQSLEHQLESRDKDVASLRSEISRVREALAHSERTGKAAEMNLLLMGQQHERTVTNLRAQLKEHEKDGERIQKLQQIVGEMREQISEMDSCLRAKCTEIEENDDKFIQLLKEKKKLTSKVETLTKRNNNLQNKLLVANSQARPADEQHKANFAPETASQQVEEKASRRTSTARLATTIVEQQPSTSSSFIKPRISSQSSLPSTATTDPSRRLSNKRPRMASPALEDIAVHTYIGQKRRLPDEMEAEPAPVEARLPDSAPLRQMTPPSVREQENAVPVASKFKDGGSLTPRHRRPLQTLRTGFTPVRGQNVLRPHSGSGQPSPIRKSSASRDLLPPAISDVTNSPPKPKRVFAAEPQAEVLEPQGKPATSRGWLDKLQSKGMGINPLSRTRQRSDDGGRP